MSSGLFIGFRMVVVGSAYAADFDVEMRQVEATSLSMMQGPPELADVFQFVIDLLKWF